MKRVQLGGVIAAALFVMSPLIGYGQASDPIFADFDPKNFDDLAKIDNKLLPLTPGKKLVLEGKAIDVEGDEETHRIELHTTGLTKKIGGVRTVVVYTNDYADDELVESEISFFAQDKMGNVWFFGEYPEEYESEVFVAAKPWIHGFEDAKAGLYMKANPTVGEGSHYLGWGPAVEWNDFAKVKEVGQENCVPVACYKDVVIIDESSLSEKGAFQVKYYAPGVGNFRVGWKGDDAAKEELELVDFVQLDADALAKLNAGALALEKHAYEISEVYKQTLPAE
ncbi:hypothetical protein [Mesorhizobium cantuariense]|uniref:Uncharacterized protein n=1 Tax=Mesorhizobium cantuariense TaxID=1300275 RepID=A0ABV7MPP8_9HYPH